jgi:hypothetical protein
VSTSIIPIRTVTARRIDFDWPFRRERADEIAAHWQAMKAEKPAMFNGQVLLQCRGEVEWRNIQRRLFRTRLCQLHRLAPLGLSATGQRADPQRLCHGRAAQP